MTAATAFPFGATRPAHDYPLPSGDDARVPPPARRWFGRRMPCGMRPDHSVAVVTVALSADAARALAALMRPPETAGETLSRLVLDRIEGVQS